MPTEDGLPDVGDVVVSSKFACAEQSEIGNLLRILNLSVPIVHIELTAHDGQIRTHPLVAHGAGGDRYDRSRGTAEFVVEEARWSDNPIPKSTGACSSRWYVAARRLNKGREHAQNDERIAFFLCGLPDKFVLSPSDIRIIGTMRMPKQKKTRA